MYRKFTATHIFNGQQLLTEPSVLITDTKGTIIDLVNMQEAGEEIEILNGLLTPGFINAHCHLELSHLKGAIPENTGLVNFVQQVMSNRVAPGDSKLEAMLDAQAEMYRCGIVAVGDICNTADSIIVKENSALQWHNFIEVSGFVDALAHKRLEVMMQVFQQFKNLPHQKTSFSPHSPYSVSKQLFHLINEITTREIITIHNQECAAENDLYQNKTGGFLGLFNNFDIDITTFQPSRKSSFQTWLSYFTNQQCIISVHNTFTSSEDIAFFANSRGNVDRSVTFCICINANNYIEQNTPPIDLLRQNNCTIIIGTDSYASNRQLNILEEIKTIQRETNYSIPLEEILGWATLNGAKALQLEAEYGSFKKGKTPGIVLIERLENLQTNKNSFARRIL